MISALPNRSRARLPKKNTPRPRRFRRRPFPSSCRAASTVDRLEQRIIRVDRSAKPAVLAEILQHESIGSALVFTRTKHGADKVVRGLAKAGISAHAIHGNKSQNQRERVLSAFRKGKVLTLIATDIAARGIDVEGISHVVNFDLPNVPE